MILSLTLSRCLTRNVKTCCHWKASSVRLIIIVKHASLLI